MTAKYFSDETAFYMTIISIVIFLDVITQFFVLKQMKKQQRYDISTDKEEDSKASLKSDQPQRPREEGKAPPPAPPPTKLKVHDKHIPVKKTQASQRTDPSQPPMKQTSEIKSAGSKESASTSDKIKMKRVKKKVVAAKKAKTRTKGSLEEKRKKRRSKRKQVVEQTKKPSAAELLGTGAPLSASELIGTGGVDLSASPNELAKQDVIDWYLIHL